MNSSRRVIGLLVPFFALLLGGAIARGDAMPPWAGASASATVFGRTTSETGPTAGASDSGTNTINYIGSPVYNYHYQMDVDGSATAGATGRAGDLLLVSSHYAAGNPGTLGYRDPVPPISAMASWSGDRVIVAPPAGGALPDAVRLQFSLAFKAAYAMENSLFGRMVLDANGQSITVAPSPLYPNYYYGPVPMTGDFDSLARLPGSNTSPYDDVGTFHIDLAVDKSGISDPFRLALTSLPNTGLISNGPYHADQSASLALTGVTLPDGTPLDEAGYGVSFASGLVVEPVPEPASLACWAVGALVGGWLIRRRAVSQGASSRRGRTAARP